MTKIESIETIYVHPGDSKFEDLLDPIEDSNIAESFDEWLHYQSIRNAKLLEMQLEAVNITEYNDILKTLDVKFMTSPVASYDGKLLEAKSEVLKSPDQFYNYDFIFSIEPCIVVDDNFIPKKVHKIRGVLK